MPADSTSLGYVFSSDGQGVVGGVGSVGAGSDVGDVDGVGGGVSVAVGDAGVGGGGGPWAGILPLCHGTAVFYFKTLTAYVSYAGTDES